MCRLLLFVQPGELVRMSTTTSSLNQAQSSRASIAMFMLALQRYMVRTFMRLLKRVNKLQSSLGFYTALYPWHRWALPSVYSQNDRIGCFLQSDISIAWIQTVSATNSQAVVINNFICNPTKLEMTRRPIVYSVLYIIHSRLLGQQASSLQNCLGNPRTVWSIGLSEIA